MPQQLTSLFTGCKQMQPSTQFHIYVLRKGILKNQMKFSSRPAGHFAAFNTGNIFSLFTKKKLNMPPLWFINPHQMESYAGLVVH